ncbi:MAG: MFS transporter [Cellvibrionales bacterium]|nr:MFS transporter [Cellvibrionales bacterium]
MKHSLQQYVPWLIATFACLALLFSNGMSITALPVFDEALLEQFNWQRGELKFRDMVTFAVVGLSAPFVGILIDRYGVRACMMVGWVILAVAYFLYSNLQSLLGLYGIHVLLGFVLVACGLNAAVILVSHWFIARRGTAIGIALVGTSLGGAVLPQLGTYMLENHSWMAAFQAGIIFPIIMLLLTVFAVRNRPEDIGLEPYGGYAAAESANEVTGVAYQDALKTRTFWALAIIAMSTFYTVLAVSAHLFLHLRDLEFSPQAATNYISTFFLYALVGKFVFGLLADYLPRKIVFLGNLAVMLLGAICLLTMQKNIIWVAVTLFGLGWGGVYTMIQLSAMKCFGLKAAGKILGTITILDALGGGLGIWLTGYIYDRFDSYAPAFWIFTALILVAIICVFQIKPVAQPLAVSGERAEGAR